MMLAAVFEGAGRPLAVREVPIPEPGPGELLIRVHRCGVCGSDLHMTDSHSCYNPPAGSVIGHELAGEVVALGAGTHERWREGARLAALPYIGCGGCAACFAGDPTQCARVRSLASGGSTGGFGQYALVSARDSVALDPGLSWEQGAFVEPIAVGVHAAARAGLRAGQRVLVLGAGPVGLAVAACARLAGASDVIVAARSDRRADLALAMGASEFLTVGDTLAKAFAARAGGPPEVIFECVGLPGMMELATGLCAPRGTVVMAGACMQAESLMPIVATMKELTFAFAVCYATREFAFAQRLIATGRIDPMPMFDGTVSLQDFPATFEKLRTDKAVCKVMLAA